MIDWLIEVCVSLNRLNYLTEHDIDEKTFMVWKQHYVGDKTTAQSNSHLIFTLQCKTWSKWGTPMRLCRGLTCLNNVFILHPKLLPSALLPRGIAPKWHKLIGYYSSSFLWGAVCKVSHAENNINILPHLASNNVLKSIVIFLTSPFTTFTAIFVNLEIY